MSLLAGLAGAGASIVGGLLGGSGSTGMQSGVAIDPNAFKIKDADKYRGQAQTQYDSAQKRVDFVQPKQQAFLESLQQQAAGQGPSLAGEQLKAAQNRNLAQQLAAAQSMRGGQSPFAQREVMRRQQEASAATNAQIAQSRMAEQLAAQQLYANQLSAQGNQADALLANYLNTGFDMASKEQQALAGFQNLSVQQALGLAPTNAAIDARNAQGRQQQISGILGGASSAIGLLSDKNQKKEIKPAKKEIKSFLDELSSKSYKYKDSSLPGAMDGERFGIVAQDLEKSKVGKSIVTETEQGKMISTEQGLGLALAAAAEMNRRLNKLEKKRG